MNHVAETKKAEYHTALIVTVGNKLAAAEAASVSRSSHYKWIEADENYRTLFERAHKQAGEALEDEARRRAKEGVEEIVYFQGTPCGVKRVYSDSLMQFLLRGAFPERYRERHQVQAELSGPGGAAIQVTFVAPTKSE